MFVVLPEFGIRKCGDAKIGLFALGVGDRKLRYEEGAAERYARKSRYRFTGVITALAIRCNSPQKATGRCPLQVDTSVKSVECELRTSLISMHVGRYGRNDITISSGESVGSGLEL